MEEDSEGEVTKDASTKPRKLMPQWNNIYKLILENNVSSNQINTALSGAMRLERRMENLNLAFTYGYHMQDRLVDLDDPNLL